VRLFRDRARVASSEFELTDANAATVAEICRRLDGIPLALELAAARVRLLGVEQIKARLGDRFKLLARSGAGASSRQQTVLAVIQWSWDHLLEPEQDLLRRLAVFTGGWTLERRRGV
jgi:predicted ATPase